jgi:hypothetical protein
MNQPRLISSVVFFFSFFNDCAAHRKSLRGFTSTKHDCHQPDTVHTHTAVNAAAAAHVPQLLCL